MSLCLQYSTLLSYSSQYERTDYAQLVQTVKRWYKLCTECSEYPKEGQLNSDLVKKLPTLWSFFLFTVEV